MTASGFIRLWHKVPAERRQQTFQRMRRIIRPAWLGTLRRSDPLDDRMGSGRGTPVDRYYIEQFLREHRADVRGRAVEVKSTDYIDRFGSGITGREVLDIDPSNSKVTIVADLANAADVPSESFDCFILTQTLQLIFDFPAALRHAHRMLRPHGVLLATLPSVSPIVHGPGLKHDYWRFTEASCKATFGEVFGSEQVSVQTYGSMLTCIAFLAGMAHEELSARELAARNPYYPLLVAVRAVKACD